MPDYEEIIQKSQENVTSLAEKLQELEKLHQDIVDLKNTAEGIPKKFEEKFKQIATLSKEYTDSLGKSTKTYLDGNNTLFTTKLAELSDSIKDFQTRIVELKKQVGRIENIDFEAYFDRLQKTLSDIFNAINSTNLTLTTMTQTLTSISQSFGAIQSAIETNIKEIIRIIEIQENNFKTLSNQNDLVKKEIRINRGIEIIGLAIFIAILIYTYFIKQ